MSGIFINYRRDDAPGVAGRLYDHLAKNFSRRDLFIDVDAIKPGRDFVKQLDAQVSQCDVLLALIGPHWLAQEDEQGRRRIQGDEDYVRIEIAGALKRDIPVIPVLVHGADMPAKDELPEDLKSLSRRQALELRHTRFASDAEAIVAALKDALPKRQKRWPLVAAAACLVAVLGLASAFYLWRGPEPSPSIVPPSLVLTGVYRLSETDSSGNKYPGILAVTDEGSALVLTRWTKGVVGHGLGHLTGGKLVVDWGNSAPASYIVGAKGIVGSTAETAEPIALSSIETAPSLEGSYTAEGRNPDGRHYAGVVTITKQQNTYHLSWKIGSSSNYEGNGELRGNILIVDWGDSTPVVYAVGENGRLVGLWRSGLGEETLIPNQ